MSERTIVSEPRPYSISEIPKVNIDYRGLIKYAHSVGKTVPELSDDEKDMFINGSSVREIKPVGKGCEYDTANA